MDAAMFEHESRCGFGAILMDHQGQFIEAISGGRASDYSSAMAEAIGIREALSWIKTRGWTSVVLEADSLQVIQAIRLPEIMISPFGRIFFIVKNYWMSKVLFL